jgi:hypothetical protein
MLYVLTCPEEEKEDRQRRHYAIVGDRAQETEAGSCLSLNVVDSGRGVVLATSCRHRCIVPGQNCGRRKIDDEALRAQMEAGRFGSGWADEMYEDDGWVSEMWQYCRS